MINHVNVTQTVKRSKLPGWVCARETNSSCLPSYCHGKDFQNNSISGARKKVAGSGPFPGLRITLSFLQHNCSGHKSLLWAGQTSQTPWKRDEGCQMEQQQREKTFHKHSRCHTFLCYYQCNIHTHTIHVAGDQPTKFELNAVAKARKGKKQSGSLGAELPLFYGEDARRIPLGQQGSSWSESRDNEKHSQASWNPNSLLLFLSISLYKKPPLPVQLRVKRDGTKYPIGDTGKNREKQQTRSQLGEEESS